MTGETATAKKQQQWNVEISSNITVITALANHTHTHTVDHKNSKPFF